MAISLGIVGFVFLLSYCEGFDKGAENIEKRKNMGLLGSALITFLNFVFLCAKFHYFLNSGNNYDLFRTKDGDYVWTGEKYHGASAASLAKASCPYSLDADGTVADLQDESKHLCQYLSIPFSGNLVSDGMTKFSIGIGLIVYFFLMWLAFGLKNWVIDEIHFNENAPWQQRGFRIFTSHACQFFLCLFIQSQQFCVLMILTNVAANDYCARLIVPVSVKKAICMYEYGVHSLPLAIIFALATAASYHFTTVATRPAPPEQNDPPGQPPNSCEHLIAFLFGLCTLYCAIHAVGFFVYWLFAGFIVGVWFEFAAIEITLRFVIVEFLSLSAFMMNDVIDHVLSCFGNHIGRIVPDGPDVDAGVADMAGQMERGAIELFAEEALDVLNQRAATAHDTPSTELTTIPDSQERPISNLPRSAEYQPVPASSKPESEPEKKDMDRSCRQEVLIRS